MAPLQSPGVLRRLVLQLDIGHFRGRQAVAVFEHHVRPELQQSTQDIMQPLARGDVTRGVARIGRGVDVRARVDQSF